jgi:F0F1-type ATP synthase membrane subunit b/b'
MKDKLDAAKTAAQNTYTQALKKAQEELKKTQTAASDRIDRLDNWAVEHVNESLDKVSENLGRAKTDAQQKLQENVKQTSATVKQKASETSTKVGKTINKTLSNASDRLKSAWKNLVK